MRVDVFNREQADLQATMRMVAARPAAATAVISISQPDDHLLSLKQEDWAGILRLEFWDFDDKFMELSEEQRRIVTGEMADPPLFNQIRANQVIDFTEKYKDRNFLVHCDAGISRSVAVGLWISETYGHQLNLHAAHSTQLANALVLRLLRRAQWEEQLNRKG